MKAVKLFLACVIFALFGCNNSDLAPTAPETQKMSAPSELLAARTIPNRNMLVAWAMEQVTIDNRTIYQFLGDVSSAHIDGKDVAPILAGRAHTDRKAAYGYQKNGFTYVDVVYASVYTDNRPGRINQEIRLARFQVWYEGSDDVIANGRKVLDVRMTARTPGKVVHEAWTFRTPGETRYTFSVR